MAVMGLAISPSSLAWLLFIADELKSKTSSRAHTAGAAPVPSPPARMLMSASKALDDFLRQGSSPMSPQVSPFSFPCATVFASLPAR